MRTLFLCSWKPLDACSGPWHGMVWTKRGILWKNQMSVFRVLVWKKKEWNNDRAIWSEIEENGVEGIQSDK